MKKIKKIIAQLRSDIKYLFLNYFVCNIPCWHIRKLFYVMLGMKIGCKSRIHMKCLVLSPERIHIGERTIINEYCFIDGRGGLNIGNDTSISVHSMLITGSHSKSSSTFAYRPGQIIIGNNVWLGSNSIVLDNSILQDKAIISAGSVFKGKAESNFVYVGNPAQKIKCRNLSEDYTQTYKPYFR